MSLLFKKKINRRTPLNSYFEKEVSELKKKINDIENNGAIISRIETAKISQSLFSTADSYYIGIESSLPSRYYKIYPTYLTNHEIYNARLSNQDIKRSRRILIARSASELRTDAFVNPQDYKKFITWHQKNGIGLYWIDQPTAEAIQKKFDLSTTDVGMWGKEHAATFRPLANENNVSIRLINRSDKSFQLIQKYVDMICQQAQRLTIEPSDLPVFTEEIVDRWDEYVGSQNFRDKHLGKFLNEKLNPAGRVLDAAAGSGYETISLLRRKFDITANEIDPLWNRILQQRLEKEGFSIETYKYDWRNLSKYLKPVYSSVVAVGNSICMVIGREQRQLCIDEFYKLLKPKGKLIIDLRNFDYIEKQLHEGKEYFSKGLLYNCDGVGGKLSIEGEETGLIKFNFFDTKTKKVLGSTIVQRIAPKEIMSQLKKAGFQHIDIYSDLTVERVEPDAELYTIVAIK